MENKLQRNPDDRIIAGVASGLADYFHTDPVWIRVVFVLAVFAGLSGILIYIILWIAVPSGPSVDYRVYEDKGAAPVDRGVYRGSKKEDNGRFIAGSLLILLGLLFLSREFDLLPYWVSFDKLWPLVLIIPGIMILAKAGKKETEWHAPVKPDESKPAEIDDDPTKHTGEQA